MSQAKITIFDPDDKGTDVYVIDQDGKPSKQALKSFGWATRIERPINEKGEFALCQESMDAIGLGPDHPATKSLGAALIQATNPLASSTGFSSSVLALTVNPGMAMNRKEFKFAMVARCCKKKEAKVPTALEIWLSDYDFLQSPNKMVKDLAVARLKDCRGNTCSTC